MRNNADKQKAFLAVFLFVVFLVFSLLATGEFIALNRTTSSLNDQISSLKEKLEQFESSPKIDPESIGAIISAIPANDNSLIVYSQLKRLAVEKGISLKSVSTASTSDVTVEGGRIIQITFVAEGESTNVLSFITDISKLSPRMFVQDVRLNKDQTTGLRGQISVRAPWRDLPVTIPSAGASGVVLSDEDLRIIEELSALREPVFTANDPTASASLERGKTNPFSEENTQTVQETEE